MIGKTKKFIKKDRKVMDASISISTLFNHIVLNYTYALISGLLLAIIPAKNYYYIGVSYLIFKMLEAAVFKRGGYTSKLGNRYIYPIPSMLGFLSGVKLSEELIKIL